MTRPWSELLDICEAPHRWPELDGFLRAVGGFPVIASSDSRHSGTRHGNPDACELADWLAHLHVDPDAARGVYDLDAFGPQLRREYDGGEFGAIARRPSWATRQARIVPSWLDRLFGFTLDAQLDVLAERLERHLRRYHSIEDALNREGLTGR